MAQSAKDANDASRRKFLRIGAGVVAGAVVAGGAEYVYFSGVASNEDSKVSTLRSQLAAARSQAASLQSQLTAAQSQLSVETTKYDNVQSQLATTQSQATSLKSQLAAAEQSTSTAQGQITALQTQLDTTTGFLTLAADEQKLVEAIAEAIIPSDSNGPGAKEAGAIYFIDRVLASDYGKNGNMYMQGPFVSAGLAGPVTVQGVTYSGGTPAQRVTVGTKYQYQMNIREFIRYGLDAFEAYCNTAYGGDFETLSAANQIAALQDIWNNKPTSFNDITPTDFAYEITMLVWCGFLMDPIYGGNQNMVGWTYTGFNGVNMGDFYGEGYTPQQLMVAASATRLQPASLAQYQKGSP